MRNKYYNFFALFVCFFVVASCLLTVGCERGGGGAGYYVNLDSSESSETSIVGTWSLASGSTVMYIHFGDDGNWKISDDAAGAGMKYYGKYSHGPSAFTGSFLSAGEGDGDIKGSYSADGISLELIEYWENPIKHLFFAGTKQ